MTWKHVLSVVLAALTLPGCAPSRLYFKPAGFASPVPPGMVVEEVITLAEGPPQSVLKVAAVGLYKREAEGDLKKRSLHLRFTFLNNQPAPVSFYPGEVRVAPEKGGELHPTLIERTRRLSWFPGLLGSRLIDGPASGLHTDQMGHEIHAGLWIGIHPISPLCVAGDP